MSVSANNEKPQPAVPKGSQKPGPEGWIRPAQKRNNKSFQIRPLLNPPSYAELGCALPAPTQKQRDFLKSHCLSKPAHSIDVYLAFTHSLLTVRSFIITGALSRKRADTWSELHLAHRWIKTILCFFSSFTVAAALRYQNLCYRPPPTVREIWEGLSPMCLSNTLTSSPKKSCLTLVLRQIPK